MTNAEILSDAAAAAAGRPAQAVEAATAALARPGLVAIDRLSLLEQRATCLAMLIQPDRAEADARSMLALAEGSRSSAHRARALAALSNVQVRAERWDAAAESAAAALEAARRSRQRSLVALALLRLAVAEAALARPAAAEHAMAAATMFQAIGDAARQGQALRVLAQVRLAQADTPEHRAIAQRAIELARAGGDRAGEGRALSTAEQSNADLGLRIRALHQASRAFVDAGDRQLEAGSYHNLSLAYGRLGLHRRARRLIQSAIVMRAGAMRPAAMVSQSAIACLLEILMGHEAAARALFAQTLAAHQSDFEPAVAGIVKWTEATLVMSFEPPSPRVVSLFRRATRQVAVTSAWGLPHVLARQTAARLAAGDAAGALRDATRALKALHARQGRPGGGMESDAIVWWQQHRALQATGRSDGAMRALESAYATLLQGIATLSDEGLRRSYLHAPRDHAPLLRAWVEHARRSSLPEPRYTAHLAGASELRESVERLVDTGLRMNALASVAELQEFLIEEVAELIGAQRVLLVLAEPDRAHLAGAQVPGGEQAGTLLQAVTPWLDEARTSRTVRLRHGPEGAVPIDQRSCLVAPLVAQQQVLGLIYADLEGLFGRFHDTDRDLLATLAAQAAVALANLRASEALERKVEERTAQLAQRAGELELINSIQVGMAAELNFQAIVDLVGDKLRQVLRSDDIGIRWHDPRDGLIHHLYVYEHGLRQQSPPSRPSPTGAWRQMVQTRQPVVAHGQAEMVAKGLLKEPKTGACKSLMGVPFMAGERLLGFISVEDFEREDAFGDAEVRMLSTVAASMGQALENARLFDETQRLLKETEQRSSELAVINSIQQGIAAVLNFQSIVNVVGDKLREVFHTGDLAITWRDEAAQRMLFLYSYEHGAHVPVQPQPDRPDTPMRRAVLERRTLVIRNTAEADALGLRRIEGTDIAKSSLLAPMFAGERYLGAVIVKNYERDNAFGDAEARLLSTVAASTGVALENARLFDETQRRAKEAAALADVGRDLSSSLELQRVMDGIARHAKDLLQAGNSAIFLPNEATKEGDQTYRAIVALGDTAEQIRATVIEAGRGIIGSLLQSGQPELINDTQADPRRVQIAGAEQRSDERLMVVPLLQGTEVQGAMAVWRQGGQPFDARELEFLVGLSLQASVALRNARLFDETRATLERQTATAEVL